VIGVLHKSIAPSNAAQCPAVRDEAFIKIPISLAFNFCLIPYCIDYAQSTITPYPTEERTADSTGCGASTRITGNPSNDGAFCRSRDKIMAGGGISARLCGPATEYSATYCACGRSRACVAGDTANDGSLDSAANCILCDIAAMCRGCQKRSREHCSSYE
jgi:hypothetical protein